MKILLTTFFILSIFTSSYADDAKVPCRYKDGSLGLNSLDKFDCKLSSKIIGTDKKIKAEFKDYVDKKLAVKLSKKTSDLIEDLALLDSYFDQNDIDLGKNKKVQESCQLAKISAPQCKLPVSNEQKQKKLSFILASDRYLPREQQSDNNSLYKRMLSKAKQVRSVNKLDDRTKCPVEGNSGDFILSSQLNTADANNLITIIKKGENNQGILELYKKYPQLKIYTSGNDDTLKKKFESVMTSSPEGKEKEFIDKYFKDEKVQEEMAENVTLKCNELKESITQFVCPDDYPELAMPHLAMKEEDRELFFDEPGDDKIYKEVSRGLSCEMEEKSNDPMFDEYFNAKNTIQSKIDYYTKDVRGEKDGIDVNKALEPFCNMYFCKGAEIKPEMLSCKNGGPISASDVLFTCKENKLQKCDPKIQKYYSYLMLLETDAKNSGISIGSMASNSSTSSDGVAQKPRGFSTFYQNFLGVEGTIASEGKKVTPVTIAEKKAEFAERKIESGTGLASLSQNREREVAKIDSRQQEPIIAERETAPGMDAHSASLRDADQFRRTFQAQQFSKPNYDISKDANGKPKKIKLGDQDSSTLDEMKKLRGELAEALGKVKGSEEEQLAAIADNNAVVVAPKGTQKDPVKNLNQGEKERLDAYRDSLNTWENKLRNWQGNLSDRDVRANSGSTATGESRAEAPAPANDQYSIGNNNSGTGVKLNKSAGGALLSGKAETPGERAPGSEKVEGEAGVVNSENLATLGKESLKKLGIVLADSFIIKVRYKEKIYSVPVKTFNHDGKSMYVPLLNDKDRELSKIVYESPLFKDYRNYQIKRQYQLDQI